MLTTYPFRTIGYAAQIGPHSPLLRAVHRVHHRLVLGRVEHDTGVVKLTQMPPQSLPLQKLLHCYNFQYFPYLLKREIILKAMRVFFAFPLVEQVLRGQKQRTQSVRCR